MVVEIDEAGNYVLGLLKGSGLVSVDASHYENSEETPCHSMVVIVTPKGTSAPLPATITSIFLQFICKNRQRFPLIPLFRQISSTFAVDGSRINFIQKLSFPSCVRCLIMVNYRQPVNTRWPYDGFEEAMTL